MFDLVEFLRVHLDQDEDMAHAATAGPWVKGPRDDIRQDYPGGGTVATEVFGPDADHVIHHEPARVLDDVQGRRRLVDLAAEMLVDGNDRDDWETVLRLLATAYTSDAGYREEWRP